MRAAILSLMLFIAVVISGAGIYTATASGNHRAVHGYGVVDLAR